jgi:hypothetical protein
LIADVSVEDVFENDVETAPRAKPIELPANAAIAGAMSGIARL